jgi:hypothetical protein
MANAGARHSVFEWVVGAEVQYCRLLAYEKPLMPYDVDLKLMLFILRNFLRAAKWLAKEDATAQQPLENFTKACPTLDLVLARDFFEHFDEYQAGRGRNRRPDWPEYFIWGYERQGRMIAVRLPGGERVDIREAVLAACDFADAVGIHRPPEEVFDRALGPRTDGYIARGPGSSAAR